MTQNLDTFVVQIRELINHDTAGTGFVLSIEGLIATCWHVVEMAGVDPAQSGTRVNVRFPGKSTDYSAAVVAGLKTDDVSILQLEEILPFGWSGAILGTMEEADGHSFKTKGYSALGPYTGLKAEGRILGTLEVESEPTSSVFAFATLFSTN